MQIKSQWCGWDEMCSKQMRLQKCCSQSWARAYAQQLLWKSAINGAYRILRCFQIIRHQKCSNLLSHMHYEKKSLLMSTLLTITKISSLWDQRKPQWGARNYWNFNNFHCRYVYSESIENQWPFISIEVSELLSLSSFTKYELHFSRQTGIIPIQATGHEEYSGSCNLKQQPESVGEIAKTNYFSLCLQKPQSCS